MGRRAKLDCRLFKNNFLDHVGQRVPAYYEEKQRMSFDDLGLSPEILRAIQAKNYANPTPIQAQSIPPIMQGKDLIGCAQTGTGKTAGFTLPILHKLQKGRSPSLRVLVLVPTRELASQVHDSIRTYGRYLRLRTTTVFGGVGFNPQRDALRRGVDILVATPGRLLDHMRQRTIRLHQINTLIIDEADRMLDMGFIQDIRTIIKSVPDQRQTLLFSATMPQEIPVLAGEVLNDPEVIEIARQGTPASGVKQVVYPVDTDRKRELLLHLIDKEKMSRVLVFTRTKHRAKNLAEHLERQGTLAEALHGDKSQRARDKALDSFRRGSVQVLVATNVAARGLDVKQVSHVVNYEMPEVPEDYVHRIGRTARAENTGDAISLVAPNEQGSLRSIERFIGKKIPQVFIPEFKSKNQGATPFKSRKQGRKPVGKKPFRSRQEYNKGSRQAAVYR